MRIQTPAEHAVMVEPVTEAARIEAVPPYVVSLGQDAERQAIAIGYSGGAAVFSLENDLLSRNEKLAAAYAAVGLDNPAIGDRLGLATDTIKTHLRRTYSKLDVEARAGLLDRMLAADNDHVMLIQKPSPKSPIDELSGRELQVADLVSKGMSNKEIADRLDLSHLTVKSHLARIGESRKMGSSNRSLLGTAYVLRTRHTAEPPKVYHKARLHRFTTALAEMAAASETSFVYDPVKPHQNFRKRS